MHTILSSRHAQDEQIVKAKHSPLLITNSVEFVSPKSSEHVPIKGCEILTQIADAFEAFPAAAAQPSLFSRQAYGSQRHFTVWIFFLKRMDVHPAACERDHATVSIPRLNKINKRKHFGRWDRTCNGPSVNCLLATFMITTHEKTACVISQELCGFLFDWQKCSTHIRHDKHEAECCWGFFESFCDIPVLWCDSYA